MHVTRPLLLLVLGLMLGGCLFGNDERYGIHAKYASIPSRECKKYALFTMTFNRDGLYMDAYNKGLKGFHTEEKAADYASYVVSQHDMCMVAAFPMNVVYDLISCVLGVTYCAITYPFSKEPEEAPKVQEAGM